MRVLFVVGSFPVLSQTFVLSQMDAFRDRGHEVSVLCATLKSDDLSQFSASQVSSYLEHARTWNPLSRYSSKSGGRFINIAAEIFAAFMSKHFDVVIAHFGDSGVRVARASRFLSRFPPILTVFHGYDVGIPYRENNLDKYSTLYARAACLLPVNNHFGDLLVNSGAPRNKVVTHHMGVDTSVLRFEPRPRNERLFQVLSIARLTEKKGIEYSIRAFAMVANTNPNIRWHYRIAGGGPLQISLVELCHELGIADRVEFLGAISHSETKTLLTQANLFVLPSVTAANGDVEGIPVALMEAMAVGVPVLSSFHSGIPELIVDGTHGRLAPERDVKALHKAIIEIYDDPIGVRRMIESARHKIEMEYNKQLLDERFVGLTTQLASEQAVER